MNAPRPNRSRLLFLLLATVFGLMLPASHAGEVVIQLIGDSTVKRYNDANPKRGWGQFLSLSFAPDVRIVNQAVLGKSSKSYQSDERWQLLREAGADYWFIQFGHNDSNRGEHRKTDPSGEFPRNLRTFIAAAREAGAKPVLVTPPPRRRFLPEGGLTRELEPYIAAMKQVGTEESVPVLDLNARASALFLELGEEGSVELMAPDDRSHFSEKGARVMAGFVAQEIRTHIPVLAAHLTPQP